MLSLCFLSVFALGPFLKDNLSNDYDLGDRKIEVIEVGGHTAGSVVLIDPLTRIAYSGDACNGNTLLEFPNSLPIISSMRALLHLKENQNN